MISIYARQSVNKKDSISIESQIEYCRSQISPENTEEIIVFQDKGYSGKNINRPAFTEMTKLINAGSVSQVIVYKIDRISRSILDFAQIIELFEKNNVSFVSTQEKFDTSTPIGRAMLNIIMVFAQLERETIQQRITDNYYARGKKGMSLGGVAPYGLKKTKTQIDGKTTGTYEPNEEQVNVLIRIYNDYLNPNTSLGKIAKALNEEKVPSPSGGVWDSCKLSRIMRNPIYVKADPDIFMYYKGKGCIIENDIENFTGENGCYLYGKRNANERKYTNVTNHRLSIGLHKGIIDSETFLKCQKKMDNNKQIKNSGAALTSWLTGLTKCAFCGYAMTTNYSHRNKDQKIYKFTCSGRKNHILCDRKVLSFNVDEIEAYVRDKIKTSAIKMLKNTKPGKKKINETRLNQCKIELAKVDLKIENLINSLAEGNEITSNYINQKILELDTKKNDIINEINTINSEYIDIDKTIYMSEITQRWDELSFEEKKTIANYFIDKILFFDDKIKIYWNVVN